MKRLVFLVMAVLLAAGCKQADSPESTPPSPEASRPAGPQASRPLPQASKPPSPASKPPGLQASKPQETPPCVGMFDLLKTCNQRSPAFKDPRFQQHFIANCMAEVKRETGFARAFEACTRAPDCETLRTCSTALADKALELGPEHVDYMIQHNQRADAMKFCEDHAEIMTKNPRLERRCGPLLKLLEEMRHEGHDHGGHNHGGHGHEEPGHEGHGHEGHDHEGHGH